MFVTFEGVDGAGKSTQLELLHAALAREGREVVVTREPGGTPLGEEVRRLLLDGPEMTAWAEAALFTAARAELVATVIRPALARDAVVLCDRYLDSSLAYQGAGRELGIERVLELNRAAVGGTLPDRTYVLVVGPGRALARLAGEHDRIERGGEDFLGRVAEGYASLAELFPDRIRAVDADRAPDEVAREILEDVRRLS